MTVTTFHRKLSKRRENLGYNSYMTCISYPWNASSWWLPPHWPYESHYTNKFVWWRVESFADKFQRSAFVQWLWKAKYSRLSWVPSMLRMYHSWSASCKVPLPSSQLQLWFIQFFFIYPSDPLLQRTQDMCIQYIHWQEEGTRSISPQQRQHSIGYDHPCFWPNVPLLLWFPHWIDRLNTESDDPTYPSPKEPIDSIHYS